MLNGNPAVLAELVAHARRLTEPRLGNCWHCDYDLDVCDCAIAKLRHAVLAWDESATPMPGAAGQVSRLREALTRVLRESEDGAMIVVAAEALGISVDRTDGDTGAQASSAPQGPWRTSCTEDDPCPCCKWDRPKAAPGSGTAESSHEADLANLLLAARELIDSLNHVSIKTTVNDQGYKRFRRAECVVSEMLDELPSVPFTSQAPEKKR